MRELKIRKCDKCGAIVKVIEDCGCNCGIQCCGEEMKLLIPNSVDASFEKHVPTYEVKDGKIFVRVNHVMEEEHFIEWIALSTKQGNQRKALKPGDAPKATFAIVDGDEVVAAYAYCNLHSLWSGK